MRVLILLLIGVIGPEHRVSMSVVFILAIGISYV